MQDDNSDSNIRDDEPEVVLFDPYEKHFVSQKRKSEFRQFLENERPQDSSR